MHFVPLLNISDKATPFQKHQLLPRGGYLSSACCLQTGPLWMMSCFVPAFICCSCHWSFRSLNLACFTFTSPSWLRSVLLLELTAQFSLFSSLITKDGWTVTVWLASRSGLCINVKSVFFFLKKPLLADVSTCGPVFITGPPSEFLCEPCPACEVCLYGHAHQWECFCSTSSQRILTSEQCCAFVVS